MSSQLHIPCLPAAAMPVQPKPRWVPNLYLTAAFRTVFVLVASGAFALLCLGVTGIAMGIPTPMSDMWNLREVFLTVGTGLFALGLGFFLPATSMALWLKVNHVVAACSVLSLTIGFAIAAFCVSKL